VITRADAEALDRENPLDSFHDRFVRGDAVAYLDGNSLGRLPNETVRRLGRVVADEWGRGLVASWDHWIDLPADVGNRLGAAVLGAAAGQVVLADSTTVSLFKLVGTALSDAAAAPVIVADAGDFPTDRYVVEGAAAAYGGRVRWIDGGGAPLTVAAVGPALDDDVALMCLSAVSFTSGSRADIVGITRAVHAAGGLVLWDLSHAAGAIPIDLDAADVDLAVGCTYKYLHGGPGAPAYLYVAERLQHLLPPVWGWWGRRDQFEMAAGYEPMDGIGRFLSGTPDILGISAVDEGVRLVADAGIRTIADVSARLTSFLIDLADEWLAPLGFSVVTPREPSERGGHVALSHPQAGSISVALRAAGVVADARPPDILRLAPTPLDTAFVDVWDGLDRLRGIVARGEHHQVAPARRVT
jgi:kynureninase